MTEELQNQITLDELIKKNKITKFPPKSKALGLAVRVPRAKIAGRGKKGPKQANPLQKKQ